MRSITDEELSDTTAKFLDYLFKISNKLTILDTVVLTNVGWCHDHGNQCGHKELSATLSISASRISKSISRWLELGYIIEVHSKTDRRRRFYIPTELMFASREVAFVNIRSMHKKLQQG